MDTGRLQRIVQFFEQAPWGEALPGMTLAIVRRQDIIFTRGFGFACLEDRRPADINTVYRVGSLTKPITALAVSQLVQSGHLDLDIPFDHYLPGASLPTRWRQHDPITIRHLLMHCGGVPREAPLDYFDTLDFPTNVDLWESLAQTELLSDPGTDCEYSNVGYALLGWVVEQVSRQPYREYAIEHVLLPLGMISSGFDLSPQVAERLAPGYLRSSDGRPGARAPDPDLGTFAAAGQLYSTVEDLGRLIAIQFGQEAPSDDHLAVRGWQEQSIGGMPVFGHDGQTFGWAADLRFVPHLGIGVVVCTNMRINARDLSSGLLEALIAEGKLASA